MKITILTLFPEMFEGFLNTSIIKKARLKGLVEFEVVDIRAYSTNKHRRVDDHPFGGGPGLVMSMQPITAALRAVKTASTFTVLTSPKGEMFTQARARAWAGLDHLVLICAHYEGMDARIETQVDASVSIGDYILTGGELPAMVIADALTRLIDGVITEGSHQKESFEARWLEEPQYTRPVDFEGQTVPEVLLSGHHERIERYRLKERLRETWLRRPDLFKGVELSAEERELLIEILSESIQK
jgi:tRNA (guanine37-N1)-methyltransferase